MIFLYQRYKHLLSMTTNAITISAKLKAYTVTDTILLLMDNNSQNLVGGTEFKNNFEKNCLSQKLFVMFSSMAVLHQKGRARVSKFFYLINLDSRQLRQTSDNARIVMHAQ